MAFQIKFAGVDDFAKRQMVAEVVIDRRIYDHSRARIVIQWHETEAYKDRKTANIAAKLLNCIVDLQWKDAYLGESVECFHGYVERASGEREAAVSRIVVECVSLSKRTDLIPRYRAFQACKMLDICQQVAKTEPLIKVETAGDLNFDIPLSLQYGETDYEYVSRMMHAYGMPMSVIEKTGEVHLGARGVASSGKFPDVEFGWKSIVFEGALDALPKRVAGGSGPSAAAQSKLGELYGQLKDKASDYYAVKDNEISRGAVSAVKSQVDPALYRLTLDSGVLPFSPGEVVKFEGQDCIIRSVQIVGRPDRGEVQQTFELQPFTLPYNPYRPVPQWESRLVWAHVTDNEKDPTQSGRLQVKFDLEKLDPQSSSEKVWLPLLTPYGGGKSPSDGKAGEYNGFYSVPEVGERVLVEFIGQWDADAVIMGVARDAAVSPMFNPKDTKRWRTPSGNEVTLTSKGGKEVVRVKCKDKVFFESKMDGANAEALITPGESDGDYIHFKKGAGPSSLYIMCDGKVTIKGGMGLHLEGQTVQIKAGGGPINIDGGPLVNINCVPVPMTPNQLTKFEEDKLSTSSKTRALPTPPTGTAASSSGADKQNEKKKTWIEIELKDDAGLPIPNERYKLKLPDGSTQEGTLDGDGRARVDGIEEGSAQVSFPDLGIDWKPA